MALTAFGENLMNPELSYSKAKTPFTVALQKILRTADPKVSVTD